MGQAAFASGVNSTSGGANSTASGASSTVYGQGASGNGTWATTVGAGASVSSNNSASIGFNSDNFRDNTVSVGQVGHERQITNVAAGTEGTDAVNLDQLHGLGAMNAALAMTAPSLSSGNDNQVSFAVGTYHNRQAAALSYSRVINDNWAFRFGTAFQGEEVMAGAAVNFGW